MPFLMPNQQCQSIEGNKEQQDKTGKSRIWLIKHEEKQRQHEYIMKKMELVQLELKMKTGSQ